MFTREAWMEALAFAKEKWFFIAGHLALATGLALISFWLSLGFLAGKEYGEAKKNVPGSVKDPIKWYGMLLYILHPVRLIQWLPHAFVAVFLLKFIKYVS